MLNIINRYKQQRRTKQIRKLAVFSTISAGIGAVTALFFNNKENREKLVKTAQVVAKKTQQASQKAVEVAEDAYDQASEKVTEFSGEARKTGTGLINNLRSRFTKASDDVKEVKEKVEQKVEDGKQAINNEFDGKPGNDKVK